MRVRRYLWLRPGAWLRLGVILALHGLGGCERAPERIEIPELTPPYDASVPVTVPDGAIPCDADEACDDGIDCTRDRCVQGVYCVNATDNNRCSDGVFCNGPEVCDPLAGCQPSEGRSCSDDSVCTVDACDEEGKRCVHDPRDFDGDGEVDWHCVGGTDCDDFDETRGARSPEVCADGVDNDCDERADESDCGTPRHDDCSDALDVSEGGIFVASLLGAGADYALGCGESAGREVAFVLQLDEARDVSVEARGVLADGRAELATLALRRDCDDAGGELGCGRGLPGSVRVRSLAPGRYFVLAHSRFAQAIELNVKLTAPTQAPGNRTCATPLDVSAGGRFESSFVGAGDDTALRCGLPDAADLTYSLTLEETSDLELLATSATGERMNVSLRTECGDPASELRCLSAAPALGRLRSLPAGEYFIVVESTSAREVDFALEVAIEPPSDAPPGDSCQDALPLRLDVPATGTLAGLQDLADVRCGCEGAECSRYLADAAFELQVAERTDVWLSVDGLQTRMHYALQRGCGDEAEQLACGDGTPAGARVQNLAPGRYFVIVEAQQITGFTLTAEALPSRQTFSVGDNDECLGAFELPPQGGIFAGDTFDMSPDYAALCGGGAAGNDAVYRLALDQRSRVRASVSAAFDSVLYRYDATGLAELGCQTGLEIACDDDSGPGSSSLLDETLDPGTYYYVVDGFGRESAGEYLFDVTVTR